MKIKKNLFISHFIKKQNSEDVLYRCELQLSLVTISLNFNNKLKEINNAIDHRGLRSLTNQQYEIQGYESTECIAIRSHNSGESWLYASDRNIADDSGYLKLNKSIHELLFKSELKR